MSSFIRSLPLPLAERRDAILAKAADLQEHVDELSDADIELVSEIEAELDTVDKRLACDVKVKSFLANGGHNYSSIGFGEVAAPDPARVVVYKPGVSSNSGGASRKFVSAIEEALFPARSDADGQVRKALLPSVGPTAFGFDGQILDLPNAPTTISSLVGQKTVTMPAGTELQETAHSINFGTVQVGTGKPTSTITIAPTTWKTATIATIVGPIANQWMADYHDLGAFIARRLGAGFSTALSNFILNGGTVEDGTVVPGVLNSGAPVQAFAASELATIRTAITQLRQSGVMPSAIAFNPVDWVSIELLTDSTGRFVLDGAHRMCRPRNCGASPSCSMRA